MDELLSPINITQTAEALHITLPVNGLDLGGVYVIAAPRNIVIEMRSKNTVSHLNGITEVQDKRIVRELTLNAEIQQGSTHVRRTGDDMEITCLKLQSEPSNDARGWSEIVRFDTRASLGCI